MRLLNGFVQATYSIRNVSKNTYRIVKVIGDFESFKEASIIAARLSLGEIEEEEVIAKIKNEI